MTLGILILVIIISLFLIELNHRLRIESPLKIAAKDFKRNIINSKQKYSTLVEIKKYT